MNPNPRSFPVSRHLALLIIFALLLTLGFIASGLAMRYAGELVVVKKQMNQQQKWASGTTAVVSPDRLVQVLNRITAPGETIAFVERNYDFVVARQVDPTQDVDAPSRIEIWTVSKEDASQPSELIRALVTGSRVSVSMTNLGYGNDEFADLDIKLDDHLEGPASATIETHVYVSGNEAVATTVRGSLWSGIVNSLKIYLPGHNATFSLITKNDCEQSWNETALGLQVNNKVFTFKKPRPFTCETFGEGEAVPAMPEMTIPERDLKTFTFTVPGGAKISATLGDNSTLNVESESFDHVYPPVQL